MKNVILITLTASAFALVNLNAVNLEMNFNDANNTSLTNVSQSLTEGLTYGSWNFGGASTQTAGSNPSGNLNVGYTSNYKGLFNNGAGVSQLTTVGDVTRRFTLDNSITSGTYTFTVVLDTWQFNDATLGSTPNMGIAFGIEQADSDGAQIALKAGNGNFAQAYGNRLGTNTTGSFAGFTSGIGLNNSYNFNGANGTKDLTIQITGDLSTGDWSTRGSLEVNNDGAITDSLSWTEMASGTGLTSIASIQMKMMTGGVENSWGVDGQTASGNWVTVDNISLNVVPEPSTYALLIGLSAFLFVAIRKRK